MVSAPGLSTNVLFWWSFLADASSEIVIFGILAGMSRAKSIFLVFWWGCLEPIRCFWYFGEVVSSNFDVFDQKHARCRGWRPTGLQTLDKNQAPEARYPCDFAKWHSLGLEFVGMM